MYCERAYLKGVSICVVILAGGLLYFVANILSDRMGRRRVFRTSIVLGVLGFVFLMWSPNLIVTILGLVLLALMIDVCNSLAFVYMSEVSPPKLRNISALAMLIGSTIGEIVGSFSALVFMDYRYMSILYFAVTIPIFVFFFWLRPTFFHLVRSKNKKSMLSHLKYVLCTNAVRPEYIKARLHQNRLILSSEASPDSSSVTLPGHSNKSTQPDPFARHSSENIYISKLPQDSLDLSGEFGQFELALDDLDPLFQSPAKQDENFIPLRKYFGKCSHVVHLIAYALLIMNLYWVKGMTVFLPEKMGFKSIYLNNFLLNAADLAGISLMMWFLNSTRRTTLNRFHLGFILTGSAVVMVLHATSLRSSLWVKVVDILLSCKFGD